MAAGPDTKNVFVPEVLWAQRNDEIYLTINLTDVEVNLLDLAATTLTFDAISKEKHYKLSLEFFNEVVPEKSKKSINARYVFVVLAKKEDNQSGYWPRLLKDTQKVHYIKTDFSRWKDDDDDDTGLGSELPNLDFSQFGGDEDGDDQPLASESSSEEEDSSSAAVDTSADPSSAQKEVPQS